MHIIILAGGYATRLRPLTLTKPKALLPILDKPLIDWVIEGAIRSRVKRITLSLHHMSDQILGHVTSRWGNVVAIDYYIERVPLGDAGPLREINDDVGIDYPVVVIYGDIFSSVDLERLYKYHRSKGGIATLTVTRVKDVRRYGVADIDEGGRVRGFVEKPQKGDSGYINAGIYVFEREAVEIIEKGKKQGIGKDLMPRLLEIGEVYAYIHEGIWNDIGVPSDYVNANLDALSMISRDGIYVNPESSIDGDVEMIPPIYIGAGVQIEGSTTVGRGTIIMRSSMIKRGSLIIGSLLMGRVIVDQSATIVDSIIGEGSYIGKWTRVSRNCIVGDGVYINNLTCLGEGTIVLPYKDLDTQDLCSEANKVIL
ncbi:MAG: NDP-sugar synthase [Desulfurococcales archaeon]|jgi:mannose-1-phosphate guanylyltransferase|nr:NDP-sugar synthase [Desulfurococcales archaeon]